MIYISIKNINLILLIGVRVGVGVPPCPINSSTKPGGAMVLIFLENFQVCN